MISRNDAETIERSVRSVVGQECDEPFEVVVAASGTDGTAEVVRRRFPSITVVDVPEPGLPGAARNAGVAVARGEFVSFPGSHVELPPGSLQARIRAHELGYSMVTGSILNGTTTPAGWAAYFLDHSPSLPDRPSGELEGVPAHCSYTREALLEAGGFPEDMRAGEDTVLNAELWRRGHRAWRAADVRLTHRNRCATPLRLVRHHFVRGRALGRILMGGSRGFRARRGVLAYLRAYPRWRLTETDERLARWGERPAAPLRPGPAAGEAGDPRRVRRARASRRSSAVAAQPPRPAPPRPSGWPAWRTTTTSATCTEAVGSGQRALMGACGEVAEALAGHRHEVERGGVQGAQRVDGVRRVELQGNPKLLPDHRPAGLDLLQGELRVDVRVRGPVHPDPELHPGPLGNAEAHPDLPRFDHLVEALVEDLAGGGLEDAVLVPQGSIGVRAALAQDMGIGDGRAERDAGGDETADQRAAADLAVEVRA